MTLYGEGDGAVRSVLQMAMPRLPRIYAPGGTEFLKCHHPPGRRQVEVTV
jgi:hypothetical protein